MGVASYPVPHGHRVDCELAPSTLVFLRPLSWANGDEDFLETLPPLLARALSVPASCREASAA